jgi:nicotinamidase/pyrazinamidase
VAETLKRQECIGRNKEVIHVARFPKFYDPNRIGSLFYPDVSTIAAQAESAGLAPAEEDMVKVLLLIIDMQVDFCHQGGTLFVPGAPADVRRLIEFIYRNAERISHITCSLDSHYPFQIFHPAWWVDIDGKHPPPFTIISTQDVEGGKWRPLFKADWSTRYVKRLQLEAKKQLTIWPYHVPIGAVGNALDPELWSAVFWHSIARRSQPTWWTKGSIPQTEHYSIVKPEIEVPEEPQGTLSTDFIQALEEYDYLVIAGEAESHCVLETAEDLVRVFRDRPDQLNKILLLKDCTSPVVHPEVDFHAIARARFAEYEKLGLRFIDSTDPLPAG